MIGGMNREEILTWGPRVVITLGVVLILWVTVLHEPALRLINWLGIPDSGMSLRLRVFCFVCAVVGISLSIYLFVLR